MTHKGGCFRLWIDLNQYSLITASFALSLTCLEVKPSMAAVRLSLYVFGQTDFQPDSALIKAPKTF